MNLTPWQIRRGVVSDAPNLAVFAARAFAEAFGTDNRPEDLRAHLATSFGVRQQTKELATPTTITLLAQNTDSLAGYAQVRCKLPPPCVSHNRPIQLYRFYVDRSAQGRGLAQLLMAAVHQAACEFHGRHLWLSVWERNPRAIAFYKKAGFEDVGATDFFVGPDRQRDRVLVAEVIEKYAPTPL